MAKIEIKQHDMSDCGAACLVSVANHYDLELPISRIRQLSGTDQKGTNILGLTRAAEKIGFDAKGVRGDKECLSKIPLPAIAHINVQNRFHHFVVLYKVSDNQVRIMDPGPGKCKQINLQEFLLQWTGVLVILMPNRTFIPGNHKISVLKRFLFLLQPHQSILIQSLIGSLFYTILGFSTSIYIQKITDHVLPNGNLELLNLMGISMLVILILQWALQFIKDVFLTRSGQEIDARLILGYYKHLLKLPTSFFDRMKVGEINSRISDAVKIRALINNASLSLIVNFFIVLFSFAIMFSYYYKLGLLMLLVIPLYSLVFLISNHLNKKVERRIMEDAANLESHLVESLNAVRSIKQFALESLTHSKTEFKFIKLLKTGYRSSLNQIFSQTSAWGISQLFTILLLWIGSYFVLRQEITPGELLSFYAITAYFTGPVSSLISSNHTIQNALIAADRLFEIMDLEKEPEEQGLCIGQQDIGDIVFSKVNFRYGSSYPVFKKLNLCIAKGQITAIVGQSGSGKSTLMHLLQKLYPINKGNIRIGTYNLKNIDVSSLREMIAVVPQKIDLFAGSILFNITLGEFNVKMQKISEICQNLGLLEFIESLPKGFNSYIGENGANLSGGQKQRIAIARALYRDPEILILDEATSSLDSHAQNRVHRVLKSLKANGKTILMISHQLSSLNITDRILVLENGSLLEQGTQSELLAQKGSFYHFWKKQNAGLIPDSISK